VAADQMQADSMGYFDSDAGGNGGFSQSGSAMLPDRRRAS